MTAAVLCYRIIDLGLRIEGYVLDEIGNSRPSFKYSQIETIWDVIDVISDNAFSAKQLMLMRGRTLVIAGEPLLSVLRTIETIDYCCQRSAYSDAYVLIRKCRDDLMLYLFILHVLNNRTFLSEEEIGKYISKPELWPLLYEKYMLEFESETRKKETEVAIEKWATNSLKECKGKGKNKTKDGKKNDYLSYFGASAYKKYLTGASNDIAELFQRFFIQKWDSESDKLNDYVHANGCNYVYDNYIYRCDKKEKDFEVIESLKNVLDVFLAILALIDGTKMHSSDYMDCLEMGVNPAAGSQCWVAPVIKDYISERFGDDLIYYIKEKDAYGMEY